jgi:hypothetical protein
MLDTVCLPLLLFVFSVFKNLFTMKLKNILIALSFVLLCSFVFSQDGYFKIKTGKIVYSYEVENNSTEYFLIFTDFGKKYAIETSIMMDGVMEKSRTIITPEAFYLINYGDKQAMRFPSDFINEKAGDENFDIVETSTNITNNGGKKIGAETVAGKNCDVYEYNSVVTGKGKFWIWNGILLKGDFIEEGYHAFIEAKGINIDIIVSASEFEVPSGFTITDMGAALKQMQEMQETYGTPDEE